MGGENLLFNDYEITGEYELYEVLETNIPGLYENTWGYKFCTPKYLQKYNSPYQTRQNAFRGYQKRLSNLTVFDLISYGFSSLEYDDGITIRVLPTNKNLNPIQFKELHWKKDVYVAEYDLEQLLCRLLKHILPPVSSNNKIDYKIVHLKDFQNKSRELFGEAHCIVEQPLEFIVSSLIKEIISEWMRYGNTNHIAECEMKKRIFAKIISSEC
ncbi:hypothetical protein [Bacillus pseudomycoides]|uniref:hypothetical protein n=1 Tax=Bacillus pseudomycoides TaxID=64104 RepID=UPI000BF0A969|nr:hypothetical protein [Bacillus pseudomycoides]PEK69599.1 hypothetical protein CN590_09890 [Bacillus pseudomycoides]